MYSRSHFRGQTDSSGAVFERIKIVSVFRSGHTFETSCFFHLAFPTTVMTAGSGSRVEIRGLAQKKMETSISLPRSYRDAFRRPEM
jgi:hypothetical protein